MAKQTLADLLEIALWLEQAAQDLYTQWGTAFADCPEVAAFWKSYADEEGQHYRAIERLRDRLTPEQLAAQADPEMFKVARGLRLGLEQNPPRIRNLNEAYQTAHEMEHSEVNTLFEFLLSEALVSNAEAKLVNTQLVRKQVSQHTHRLMFEFPEAYRSAQARSQVRAKIKE